jgi:uncharacterized protein (DUF1778 family)
MAGKPKKPEEVKEFMLRIRMTHAEHELLEQAAKSLSLGVSSWARSELVKTARRVIGRKQADG